MVVCRKRVSVTRRKASPCWQHSLRWFVVFWAITCSDSTPTTSCSNEPDTDDGQARVAVAVQGKCEDLPAWQGLLTAQHYHHQLDFFYLAYDEDPEACRDGSVFSSKSTLLYGPSSTWSSGRNALAKAIFAEEQDVGATYKYWLMADSDMRHLQCHYCRHMERDSMSPCCFDQLLHFLLGSQQFAVVAINQLQQNETAHRHFSRHECPDAMLNAFHRAAVPVLLPYNDGLENISWYISQQFVFHLAHACVRGGGVTMGGFSLPASGSEHAEYPRGWDSAGVDAIIKRDYRQLIPWPITTSDTILAQNQCSLSERAGWERRFTSAMRSSAWQKTPAYELCLTYLKQKFEGAMG